MKVLLLLVIVCLWVGSSALGVSLDKSFMDDVRAIAHSAEFTNGEYDLPSEVEENEPSSSLLESSATVAADSEASDENILKLMQEVLPNVVAAESTDLDRAYDTEHVNSVEAGNDEFATSFLELDEGIHAESNADEEDESPEDASLVEEDSEEEPSNKGYEAAGWAGPIINPASFEGKLLNKGVYYGAPGIDASIGSLNGLGYPASPIVPGVAIAPSFGVGPVPPTYVQSPELNLLEADADAEADEDMDADADVDADEEAEADSEDAEAAQAFLDVADNQEQEQDMDMDADAEAEADLDAEDYDFEDPVSVDKGNPEEGESVDKSNPEEGESVDKGNPEEGESEEGESVDKNPVEPTAPNVTVPTAPNVTVPTTPNVTIPTVPTTPNVTVPTTPNVTIPTVPTTPNVTVPTTPNVTIPTVPTTPNATVPTAPNTTVPTPAPNGTANVEKIFISEVEYPPRPLKAKFYPYYSPENGYNADMSPEWNARRKLRLRGNRPVYQEPVYNTEESYFSTTTEMDDENKEKYVLHPNLPEFPRVFPANAEFAPIYEPFHREITMSVVNGTVAKPGSIINRLHQNVERAVEKYGNLQTIPEGNFRQLYKDDKPPTVEDHYTQ